MSVALNIVKIKYYWFFLAIHIDAALEEVIPGSKESALKEFSTLDAQVNFLC